jgi:prephenate dehydratase
MHFAMTAGKKDTKTGSSSKALKVAIQGYEGSFHQEAARKFFGKNVQVIPCDNFRRVIKIASDQNESDGGVMAIENSIAGSILPNYNLLQKSNLTIVGEKYLHIRQHLLVNPGVQLTDIKEVHSHPMALLQCIDYLEQHHSWKLVETDDTALSARYIQRHKSRHTAAIASKLAAELYELDIVAPDIHTLKNNYTRFLMVQRKEDALVIEDADKASVYFETDHSHGSLAKVLTAIASQGINLSKLQSMPIPGSDFLYGFYADMEIAQADQFEQLIGVLDKMTVHLKVFGIYKKGILK